MQAAYLCHSKCLRTLRRQINVVARRFGADCVSNLVAQNMWSRLRRILWLQKPKEAIPDCYCGWKYLYFDASYVAHIQLSTLGSQIRATYARGDLVLNPQSVVLLPRLSRDSQRCFKRAVSWFRVFTKVIFMNISAIFINIRRRKGSYPCINEEEIIFITLAPRSLLFALRWPGAGILQDIKAKLPSIQVCQSGCANCPAVQLGISRSTGNQTGLSKIAKFQYYI